MERPRRVRRGHRSNAEPVQPGGLTDPPATETPGESFALEGPPEPPLSAGLPRPRPPFGYVIACVAVPLFSTCLYWTNVWSRNWAWGDPTPPERSISGVLVVAVLFGLAIDELITSRRFPGRPRRYSLAYVLFAAVLAAQLLTLALWFFFGFPSAIDPFEPALRK